MAECVVSYDLQTDPLTSQLSLVITDSNGAVLPVNVDLKPLIQQCVEQLVVDQVGCLREYPDPVQFIAGPGATNSSATAAVYRLDDRPTKVCVIDSDTGQEALYVILKDSEGDPQWHQWDN